MPAITQPHGWRLPLTPAPLVGIQVLALGALMDVRGFPVLQVLFPGASSSFTVEKHLCVRKQLVVGHVLLRLCWEPRAARAGLGGSTWWSPRPGRDRVGGLGSWMPSASEEAGGIRHQIQAFLWCRFGSPSVLSPRAGDTRAGPTGLGAVEACLEAGSGASICAASSPAKKREMALLLHGGGSRGPGGTLRAPAAGTARGSRAGGEPRASTGQQHGPCSW